MTERSLAAEAHRLVSFINTLHRPDGDDALADGRGLPWLSEWLGPGSSGRVERVDQDALLRLRTLREGLRQLAVANNGEQPDEQLLARAAAVLGSAPLVVELGTHRQAPRLVAAAGGDTSEHGIAAAAGCYIAVRVTADWPRLKACAAPDCQWAYLDTSRNRSRRWCDMADCGNRAKNRNWRERRRNAEDSPAAHDGVRTNRTTNTSGAQGGGGAQSGVVAGGEAS